MSGMVMNYSVRLAITCYIAFFFLNFYIIYLVSSILLRLKLNDYIKINLDVSFLINLFWILNGKLIIILIIAILISKIYIFELYFIIFIILIILDILLGYFLKKTPYVGGRYRTRIVKMI